MALDKEEAIAQHETLRDVSVSCLWKVNHCLVPFARLSGPQVGRRSTEVVIVFEALPKHRYFAHAPSSASALSIAVPTSEAFTLCITTLFDALCPSKTSMPLLTRSTLGFLSSFLVAHLSLTLRFRSTIST